MFEPVGIDRWAYELALKYGMRDGFICPVGGRWAVAFWSRKVLSCRTAIIGKLSRATPIPMENAAPDRRWRSVQWHI
jgi:hypothetical protein